MLPPSLSGITEWQRASTLKNSRTALSSLACVWERQKRSLISLPSMMKFSLTLSPLRASFKFRQVYGSSGLVDNSKLQVKHNELPSPLDMSDTVSFTCYQSAFHAYYWAWLHKITRAAIHVSNYSCAPRSISKCQSIEVLVSHQEKNPTELLIV